MTTFTLLLLLLAPDAYNITIPDSLADWERIEDEKSVAHVALVLPEDAGAVRIQLFQSGLGGEKLEKLLKSARVR